MFNVHPFLFALMPAIFMLANNFGEVSLREVVPALIVLGVFGGFVLAIFWLYFRVLEKTAIVASVFIFLTLSFGYIYNIFFFNSLMQLRWRLVFIILGLVFALIFYAVNKTKSDLSTLNRIMTIAIGTFILISIFQVGQNYILYYKKKSYYKI